LPNCSARIIVGHEFFAGSNRGDTPRMEFIEVDYPTLVRASHSVVPQTIEFLGKERIPYLEEMAALIDASLHRQKSGALSERCRCWLLAGYRR
jgi:hypothetical protein